MNDKNGLQIFVYESNKNKIKQPPASQLGILPKLHCTYIICGRSGSGKTQVCLNLLNSKSLLGGSFDEIYYFCDSYIISVIAQMI
jgi:hypothetical protein